MSKTTINGRSFLRALTYALRICPSSESASKLAHVVLIDNKIICADGARWHCGIMQGQLDGPRVIARESAVELGIRLDFAETISRRHSSGFFVHLDGNRVDIHFGDEKIPYKMADVDVGYVPSEWVEPVAPDAPALSEVPEVHCQHIKDMASWWKSWERDHGSVKMRGFGGDNPIRYDISMGDESVAVAFLIPVRHRAAQLPLDEPLFANKSTKRTGQSILDLSFEIPPPIEAQTIRIGDVELNVTGLGDARELLASGPCDHREELEPCLQCTEATIAKARTEQQVDATRVVPIGGKKKKKAPPRGKKGGGQPEAT